MHGSGLNLIDDGLHIWSLRDSCFLSSESSISIFLNHSGDLDIQDQSVMAQPLAPEVSQTHDIPVDVDPLTAHAPNPTNVPIPNSKKSRKRTKTGCLSKSCHLKCSDQFQLRYQSVPKAENQVRRGEANMQQLYQIKAELRGLYSACYLQASGGTLSSYWTFLPRSRECHTIANGPEWSIPSTVPTSFGT